MFVNGGLSGRAKCECHECTQARWKMSGMDIQQGSIQAYVMGKSASGVSPKEMEDEARANTAHKRY
jgi:hypothetical protein